MLIICPTCVSTYRLPEGALQSKLTAVRCAQCASVFDPAAGRAFTTRLEPVAFDATARGIIREPPFRPALPDVAGHSVSARPTGGLAMALAIVVIGLNMAGVAFRSQIADAVPMLAPVYAAIGLPAGPVLTFDRVETDLGDDGSGKVLAVAGRIANAGPTETAVPNLRIVVRDGAEQSIYSWTTPAPRARLAPGESVDFRSRLAAPPSASHDVVVSFASPSDTGSANGVQTGP